MRPFLCRYRLLIPALSALALSALLALPIFAQGPRFEPTPDAMPLAIDSGASGLWQSLLRLHTRASLLMITAHPDDEDGGMLTYESRGEGVDVSLLTLNRGESGANAMSSDFFDNLGLVRTEELLAAGRYYGVRQYFTRVVNFGFSKTREESLQQWGHERVLYDAVRVVRMVRPLVVTSVFIGGPSDGHGNHEVAGETAQEVMRLAGDPKAFPDQIAAGLRPWTPLKEYARVPMARVTAQGVYDYANHHWAPAVAYDYIHQRSLPWSALTADVDVPTGTFAPMLSRSYLQIAMEGLGWQKSQNGGVGIPAYAPISSAYHRFDSRVATPAHESSFFDGIDVSLAGIASLAGPGEHAALRQGLAAINKDVEAALHAFDARHPETTAPALARGLQATTQLLQALDADASLNDQARDDIRHELQIKQVQFNQALAQALGLSLRATVAPEHPVSGPFAELRAPDTFRVALPGQRFWVNLHVGDASGVPVQLQDVAVHSPITRAVLMVTAPQAAQTLRSSAADVRIQLHLPDDMPVTRPYFRRKNVEQPYYDLVDSQDLNRPLAPYPVAAEAEVGYSGVTVDLSQVVQTVQHEPGRGPVLEPLLVGPALSLQVEPVAGIVPIGASQLALTVRLHSNVKGPAQGTLRLELPHGWRSTPAQATFTTLRDGDERELRFAVRPTAVTEQTYTLTAVATYQGHDYREGYHTAGWPGLRPYNHYRPATLTLHGVRVQVAPNLRIGYVTGSGDDVPAALADNLGIHVHLLAAQDLASGDLSQYDAILLGVRAYAVRDDLKANNARLLEYVKNGGILIVQYNTPEFDHDFGPYPYVMTSDPEEVTEEDNQVHILQPANPIFNWPNRITSHDFDGWVAERGSKFLQSWDPHYVPLVETHDTGQAPQRGGLLYARYGKGVYVYCALAFYRQLPQGVPGAYRLFANLVSLPKYTGER